MCWIRTCIRCKVALGTRCLIRFTAPMPEATFFVSLSVWLLQSCLLSIVTPSDFAVVTWLTWLSLFVIVGESVKVLNLCLEPISINSVLVVFRVSLFSLSQLWTFSKSWFKYNWRLSTQSPAYVKWVSSAYILGWQLDRQFGRSLRARTRIVLTGACWSTIDRNVHFHFDHMSLGLLKLSISSQFWDAMSFQKFIRLNLPNFL